MAQALHRQARAQEAAAAQAPPTLGPNVRATEVEQLKQGINVLASLVGPAGPLAAPAPVRPSAAGRPSTAPVAAVPVPSRQIHRARVEAAAPARGKGKGAAQVPVATSKKVAAKKAASKKAPARTVQRPGLRTEPEPTAVRPEGVSQTLVGKGGEQRRGAAKQRLERLNGISKPDLRRLARRAGCQRMASTIYEEAREALAGFLGKVLGDVAIYTEHARRKTVVPQDIVLSLRRRGRMLYGVG
ncbi:unnamed protein product [Polarella glacialis]|uniref:Histone H4 n=1 Tax=Polarella glacialis TaxID=89957 RepID=A0A813G8C0_POLGL|nr:unnamed protein product [Polarella glacialis]CAE8739684.1 unnamed protein product [Polarella glacialis]